MAFAFKPPDRYRLQRRFALDSGDTSDEGVVVVPNTADAATLALAPTLEFTGTDSVGHDVTYNVQIAANTLFTSPLDKYSGTRAGTAALLDSYPYINFTGGEVELGNGFMLKYGQSFNSGAGGTLNSCSFGLIKIGAPPGNVTATLYVHTGAFGSGGTPTGSALATSDAVSASSVTGESTTFTFSGDNRVSLNPGTAYFIALEYNSGGLGDHLNITVDGTSPTHGGNSAGMVASTWASSTADVIFSIYTVMPIEADEGFLNTVSWGDGDPFTSGQKVSFTVQAGDELTTGTYYWRARGRHSESTSWSEWTTTRSFTAANIIEAEVSENASVTLVESDIGVEDWVVGSDVVFAGAQSFEGNGLLLHSVTVYLRKEGTPSGDIRAKLFTHSGTFGETSEPFGGSLATSTTIVAASSLTEYFSSYTFLFDPVVLANGTPYCIAIDFMLGTASDIVYIAYDPSDVADGNISTFSDLFGWEASTGDFRFAIDVRPPATATDAVAADVESGAGTEFDATIAEGTATAVDTPSASVVIPAGVVEGSATAVDTPNAGLTVPAVIVEGARNLAVYTQAPNATGWSRTALLAITPDGETDPFGGTTAEKLVPNSTLTTHNVQQLPQETVVAASTDNYVSSYLKAAGYNWAAISFIDKNIVTTTAYFNVGTGTPGSGGGTMEDAGGGYWRCKAVFNTGTGSYAFGGSVRIHIAEADGDLTFSGDTTSGIIFSGLQRELNGFTPYEPVLTTRPADTQAASATVNSTNAEGSATAVDAVSADLGSEAVSTAVEGSATALDTPSASGTLVGSAVEGSATAVDTPSATSVFPANVVEGSATAVDAPSATMGATRVGYVAWIRFFAPPSAGGTVFNVEVVEGSATAVDTVVATHVVTASVVEGSATAADTCTTSVVALGVVAEVSTALDTQSATSVIPVVVVEGSATALDTQSARLTFASVVAEGSPTAFDTQSATSVIPVAVVEGSATAVDTSSAAALLKAEVVEGSATALDTPSAEHITNVISYAVEGSVTALDTPSASALLKADVVEGSATALDTPSARVTWSASVVEGSPTALDTVSAGLVFPANVVEGSPTALDTQSAGLVFPANVVEGSPTALDTVSASLVVPANVVEGSPTAVDTSSAAASLNVSVTEGAATALDTVSADHVSNLISYATEGSPTAVDTPSARGVFVATVAEGSATATDSPSAYQTFIASVLEGSATATDFIDAIVAKTQALTGQSMSVQRGALIAGVEAVLLGQFVTVQRGVLVPFISGDVVQPLIGLKVTIRRGSILVGERPVRMHNLLYALEKPNDEFVRTGELDLVV